MKAFAAAGIILLGSCQDPSPAPPVVTAAPTKPVSPPKPAALPVKAGKLTVITFVTTGSIDAQAQLGYLVAMSAHDAAKPL